MKRTRHAGRPVKGTPVWKLVLKALVLALIVVLGTLAVAPPGNGSYYTTTTDFIGSLVAGFLVAFVPLVVVGSVGHFFARREGNHRSWLASVTTFPVLVITLILLNLSAAGRIAQHENDVKAAAPNPTGTLTEREKANREAHAWSVERNPYLEQLRRALARNEGFFNAVAKGNTPALRRMGVSIRAQLEAVEADLAALPQTPLPDLRKVDSDLVQAVAGDVAAYDDYLAGLKANVASNLALSDDKVAIALLKSGDVKFNRSRVVYMGLPKRLKALDAKYGIP